LFFTRAAKREQKQVGGGQEERSPVKVAGRAWKARCVTKWLWGMFWRDTGAAGAIRPSLAGFEAFT
jgi:hypothetical protein